MKLLLDECLPKALKHNFLAGGHECSTVPEAGFAGKTNGQLLALAGGKFEVFFTLDKGVQFQRNLARFNIAVILIRAKSSRVADILPLIPQCLSALLQIKRGEIVQIGEKSKTT
jgi:predicted nuclease of predicted toxin-antitoxin system